VTAEIVKGREWIQAGEIGAGIEGNPYIAGNGMKAGFTLHLALAVDSLSFNRLSPVGLLCSYVETVKGPRVECLN